MSLLRGLRNLRRQRPIRTPDGRWDVAVWVDRRGLNEEQIEHGEHILDLARQEGIPVYQKANELIQMAVHTLFVVGHNSGETSPGLLKDLRDLGTRLQGRFIILNSCGYPFNRPEVRRLHESTGTAGVFAYHRRIPMEGVRQVFEEFVTLGHQEPGLLPGVAAGWATEKVVALIQNGGGSQPPTKSIARQSRKSANEQICRS